MANNSNEEEVRTAARILGSIKTARKAEASRENGTKGGRKKGTPQTPETRAKISETKRLRAKVLSERINEINELTTEGQAAE